MLRTTTCFSLSVLLGAAGCIDTKKIAAQTTSKVLTRAQPAMKQESDYELAARAIPGALKTVEGFHLAYPDIRDYTSLLAEGYCQYGSGFVEDEWEVAYYEERNYSKADQIARRAAKLFIRCMNYGLELLGGDWSHLLYGDLDRLVARARETSAEQRTPLLWAAVGLVSAINMSKDNPAMLAHISTGEYLLRRVIVMDGDEDLLQEKAAAGTGAGDDTFRSRFGVRRHPPGDPFLRALPHLALGMVLTARGAAIGGDPAQGQRHFLRAIELTGGRLLLAKVLYAKNYGVITQKRDLFRSTLREVLKTDPAIWPEQRLANEIAQRRARRYLKLEQVLF